MILIRSFFRCKRNLSSVFKVNRLKRMVNYLENENNQKNERIADLKQEIRSEKRKHEQELESLQKDFHILRVKYDATKQQREKFLYEDMPKMENRIKELEESLEMIIDQSDNLYSLLKNQGYFPDQERALYDLEFLRDEIANKALKSKNEIGG